MSLTITITDAGRAALVNAENSGAAPVTISEIALGSGQYTPAATQTGLTNELKRIETISGEVVSDDTINVVLKDESSDDYQVGEFGLYTDGGVLFAVYSQPSADGWVAEKFAGSSFLLAVDVVLESLNATSLTVGDLTFTNPPASETLKGVVELADSTESVDRDNHERVSTPKAVHEALAAFGLGSQDAAHVSDFNAVTENGLYFGQDANHAPGSLCFLIHAQRRYSTSSSIWGMQIAIRAPNAFDQDEIYFRIRNGGVWAPWRRVWSETSFDPASKANVAELDDKLNISEFNLKLSGFITSNGYQKFPSGLIMQWGQVYVSTDGAVTVTLPISFPSAMFQAQATLTKNSSSNLGVSTYDCGTSSFKIRNSDAAQNVVWVAFGE